MNPLEHLLSQWKKVFLYGLQAVIVAMLFGPAALAQTDASLSGQVTDGTGAAIPEASVRITNLETGSQRALQTNEDGRFIASSLPVGNYSVAATKEGFRSETKTGIVLTLGEQPEGHRRQRA